MVKRYVHACRLLALNEAMQRRLALCSHHASSGALLLLLREQSRGQGRGQTGAQGMTLLGSGASQMRVRWGLQLN